MAKTRPAPRPRSEAEVLMVQIGIAAVILLLALSVRFIGATVYDEVHEAFRGAITEDILLPPEVG